MKVSYFPGCTLRTKAKDLDEYARRAGNGGNKAFLHKGINCGNGAEVCKKQSADSNTQKQGGIYLFGNKRQYYCNEGRYQ